MPRLAKTCLLLDIRIIGSQPTSQQVPCPRQLLTNEREAYVTHILLSIIIHIYRLVNTLSISTRASTRVVVPESRGRCHCCTSIARRQLCRSYRACYRAFYKPSSKAVSKLPSSGTILMLAARLQEHCNCVSVPILAQAFFAQTLVVVL